MGQFIDEKLAERAGKVSGEAGIAHLRAPLAGIRFHTLDELVEAVQTVFGGALYRICELPTFSVNPRLGNSTHGMYSTMRKHVEIAPLLGLATALHEVAHHINSAHGGDNHDAGFKRICGNLYKIAADQMGLKRVRPSDVSLVGKRPVVGDEVRVDHPKFRGLELEVIKVNRSRARVQCGTRIWNVPFRMLTPLSGGN